MTAWPICAAHKTALYPDLPTAQAEHIDRKMRAAWSKGTPTALEPRRCRTGGKNRGWHLLPPAGPITTRADAEQLVRRLYQWAGDLRIVSEYAAGEPTHVHCQVCQQGIGQVLIRWDPKLPEEGGAEMAVCSGCVTDYLDGVVIPDAGDPVDFPAPIEITVRRAAP